MLGRGGMGIVYQARQVQLKRLVALKMILSGDLAGARERERFCQEAEAVARLQHRHVVRIYEIGQCESRPFFSLEYVPGGSLARRLGGVPQDARESARLVELLARAVQSAHEVDIVHRDLKPANILLAPEEDGQGVKLVGPDGHDGRWEPRITDFGLAKDLGGASSKTHTGQILGTPSYMAPEQAAGQVQDVGPASDIWALGAILYELLTGQPPFKGISVLETLELVRSQEPVSPGRLQPKLPADLETICLKCLQKDPGRRYRSALELADDLQHFQEDRPIQARPVAHVERLWRWARRNPGLAAAIALAVLFLIGGAAFSTYFAIQESLRSDDLALETERANSKATEASFHAEQANLNLKKALASAELARQESAAADQARDRADQQKLKARHHAYAAAVSLAHKAWENGLPQQALELLRQQVPPEGEQDLRGFEWFFLWELLHNERLRLVCMGQRVPNFSLTPDGKKLATAGFRGFAQVWDLENRSLSKTIELTGQIVTRVAIDPAGRHLAVGTMKGKVLLFDAVKGKQAAELCEFSSLVSALAFSPDGKLLAAGNNRSKSAAMLKVFDATNHKLLYTLDKFRSTAGFLAGIQALAFSQDNKRMAVGTGHGDWQTFEPRTGNPLSKPVYIPGSLLGLSFSRDGKRLASCSGDRRVRIWDASTGEEQLALAVNSPDIHEPCFSPDGRKLAVGTAHGAVLWDLATWQKQGFPHPGSVHDVAFSPDGSTLLTAGADGTIRQWELRQEGGGEACGRWHTTAVGFPRGSRVVAVGEFNSVLNWWDAGKRKETGTLKGPDSKKYDGPAYALNGPGRLAAGAESEIRIWDSPESKPRNVPSPFPSPKDFAHLTFSLDGKQLAAASSLGELVILDADTGREQRRIMAGAGAGLALSPDGKLVARLVRSGNKKWQVALWLMATGAEWRRWVVSAGASTLNFSADGKFLGVGHADGIAQIWRIEPLESVAILRGHLGLVRHLTFSPDGKTLATAGDDTTVRLWQVATGLELLTLRGHKDPVLHVAFAADNRALASGAGDDISSWGGSARYWRAAAREQANRELARTTRDSAFEKTWEESISTVLKMDTDARQAKKNKKATQHGKRAIEILQATLPTLKKYAAASPTAFRQRWGYPRALLLLAYFHGQMKSWKEASSFCLQARPELVRLVTDFPETIEANVDLGILESVSGAVMLELREWSKSEACFKDSLACSAQVLRMTPGNPLELSRLRSHILAFARLREKQKDHANLAGLAQDSARLLAHSHQSFMDAAKMCGRAAEFAGADVKLDPIERQKLSKGYGDQAIAFLTQAVEHGFSDRTVCDKDSAFNGLRQRQDFGKLMDTITAAMDKTR